MQNLIQLLKSRTVWYALIVAVLSVVQAYVGLVPTTPVNQMLIGCAISVGIVIMRLLTTMPVSDK